MPKSVTELDRTTYSALVAASPQGREYKSEAHAALDARPGQAALDIGCGPGTDLQALADAVTRTGTVIGVDLRAEMVEVARQRMVDVPWVKVLEGDALALPLEDHSVDRARADRTIQHVADPAAAFAEMRRVLRPGGIAVLTEPDWASAIIDGDLATNLAFNRYVCTEVIRNATIGRQMRRLALNAGFEVSAIHAKARVYDDFEYCDKVAGLRRNTKRAIKAGYIEQTDGERWLEELQNGPFFASSVMFMAVLRNRT
jgi:ubiquinone/menaquinone biosynthesis C-methylase UbiE